MPATQPTKELRAFCHEHHVEMRLNKNALSNKRDNPTQTLAYACTEPDCLVHYNTYRGYFILSQNGITNEPDTVPSVRCPHDGTPCISLTSICGKGLFACGYARNAIGDARMRRASLARRRREFRMSAGKAVWSHKL